MQAIIDGKGVITTLYTEAIDLGELGEVFAVRASDVEPSAEGKYWTADMGRVAGPLLGPFKTRSEAIAAEVAWLEEHVLCDELA